MHCFCGDTDAFGYEGLHAHLIAAHPELVALEDTAPRPQFVVSCPLCQERYVQHIKRGRVGAEFVEEYAHEIRLVATDICAQHLIGEHPGALGLDDLIGEAKTSTPVELHKGRH